MALKERTIAPRDPGVTAWPQIARRKGAAVLRPYKRFSGGCGERRSALLAQDGNDPVKVIRHNHKFVEPDVSKVQRNSDPAFPHESAQCTRNETGVTDLAEDGASLVRTNGDKVRIQSAVITPS